MLLGGFVLEYAPGSFPSHFSFGMEEERRGRNASASWGGSVGRRVHSPVVVLQGFNILFPFPSSPPPLLQPLPPV